MPCSEGPDDESIRRIVARDAMRNYREECNNLQDQNNNLKRLVDDLDFELKIKIKRVDQLTNFLCKQCSISTEIHEEIKDWWYLHQLKDKEKN